MTRTSCVSVLLLASSLGCGEDPETVEPGGNCQSIDGTDDCSEAPLDLEPEGVTIEIDDDNRFVEEDLDRFMREHPDVMREEDEAVMRTCRGDACIEGVDPSITPFEGEGTLYVVPRWYRACLSGSGAGCIAVAQTYNSSQTVLDRPIHEGRSEEELWAKTQRYAARACTLSEDHCRMWASGVLADDASSDADVARAVRSLTAECDAGVHHGCGLLGRRAASGHHVEAIGAPREWLRRACAIEVDDGLNRYCGNYARILYESGARADRAEAERVIAPMCDPTSDGWRSVCHGDADAGTQECRVLALRYGTSCTTYAASLAPTEALPLLAAMCLSRPLAADGDAAANDARCEAAIRHARRLHRPDTYLRAVRTRQCAARASECLDGADGEAECERERAACVDDGL